MRLVGIVTKDPIAREVTLKAPRPNEPKTKSVTEVSVLDDDGGDVVNVQAWGDGAAAKSLGAMKRGEHVELRVSGVSSYMGTTRATLVTDPATT